MEEIKVWVKAPGEDAKMCTIRNDLEEFQRIVGGYIEVVPLTRDMCIVCNEDGKLIGLPINFRYGMDLIVGTAILAQFDGEDFCSCSYAEEELLK